MIFEIVYLIIVTLLSLMLLRKYEQKFFMGLMTFWLLGYPILGRTEFMLSATIGGVQLDFQPNRWLLVILGTVFVFRVLNSAIGRRRRGVKLKKVLFGFNSFVVLYTLLTILAIVNHVDSIGGWSRALALISNALVFLLVYYFSMEKISKSDFQVFLQTAQGLLIFSMLVSVIQFFISPEFFRYGVERAAFSNFVRSNGIFYAEYDQGMYAIFVLWLTLNRGAWVRQISVFIASGLVVILSMHRLSWLILAVLLVIYGAVSIRRQAVNALAAGLLCISVALLLLAAMLIPWDDPNVVNVLSELFTERIRSDTLSIRRDYNMFGLELIRKYPLGLGSYETKIYHDEAFAFALIGITPVGQESRMALVVHNGFLSAGVKAGVLGMISFGVFLLGLCVHFLRASIRSGKSQYPPLFIALTYLLYNTTNDFSDFSNQLPVLFGLLIGYFLSAHNQNVPSHDSTVPV